MPLEQRDARPARRPSRQGTVARHVTFVSAWITELEFRTSIRLTSRAERPAAPWTSGEAELREWDLLELDGRFGLDAHLLAEFLRRADS